MLITLIFYGSEHIRKQAHTCVIAYGTMGYKDFRGACAMLIGSKIPQIVPNLYLVES